MTVSIPPQGLIVDLITPLRNDRTLDGRGLGRLLDHLLPRVDGLLVASPNAGEGTYLDSARRVELFEMALVVVRGRLPLLVWITQGTEEGTTETLLRLSKALERRRSYGGPVFWVDTPLYYHSNRGLPALYRDMCRMVDEPLILYNDPGLIKGLAKPMKRCDIRTAILKELVQLKQMVGLIFLGTLDRAHNYQRACRERKGFSIYDGDESHFLDHPSRSGVVSAGANAAPEAWKKITGSSLPTAAAPKSDPEYLQRVWDLGKYVQDLKDVYGPMPAPVIKEILAARGLIETAVCAYPIEDTSAAKQKAAAWMARNDPEFTPAAPS
ncbi:MAG: dihydrodipicolinate synthase family protein [Desulfatiglandaceae bacterium]